MLLSLIEGKDLTEAVVRKHVKYLKELDEKGQLVLAGPFLDYRGGMIIVKVKSQNEAMMIAKNDPFVKENLESFKLREWELSCKENNHIGMG
ncbi:MAG: hypothetical protein GY936_20910 [Ignavibacteriae bacterium]|nr:hypothetical protein [Ignavibacteriota bacterium]